MTLVICPHCKRLLMNDERICPDCGAPYQPEGGARGRDLEPEVTVEEAIGRTVNAPSRMRGMGRTIPKILAAIGVIAVLFVLFKDVTVLFDGELLREYRENIHYDGASGLLWHKRATGMRDHEYADAYCEALRIGDGRQWRLPTITELRTLVKGCPGTVSGGICPVGLSCLMPHCRDDNCACGAAGGPGEEGLYWEEGSWEHIFGGSRGYYWSSSRPKEDRGVEAVWTLSFLTGAIELSDPSSAGHVRCVSGPVPVTERLKQRLIFGK